MQKISLRNVKQQLIYQARRSFGIIPAILAMLLQWALPVHSMPNSQHTEVVMTPGMKITATTSAGIITITAREDFVRSYTWEGATRSVEMEPREERWYGSLGLYYAGPGDHWDVHNGITRGVLEEGQQHFKTLQEAIHWLHSNVDKSCVFKDDGLVVGWSKNPGRKQLNVDVWQLYVQGKRPTRLPGSQNARIRITYVQTEISPLVRAVLKNDLETVERLLKQGSDANTKSSVGYPVLVLAAKHGSVAIINALRDKGADVNARDQDGSTALIEAIGKQHASAVKELLTRKASVNETHLKGLMEGMTPLMLAAMLGNISILQMLLDSGADVNARDKQLGATAMKFAQTSNHPEAVRLLQKSGAKE